MRLPRALARSLSRLGPLLCVLASACALGGNPSPSHAPAVYQSTYATWELDTLAELDQLLNVKGCEGWRLAQAFSRGEKIVAILTYDGTQPPPTNPACRLTA